MQLTVSDVKAIFVSLLQAKMSREEADRWAYSMIKEDEHDRIEFYPPEDREQIMKGLRFLYGVDLRTSPTEYLHSDSDIAYAYDMMCSNDHSGLFPPQHFTPTICDNNHVMSKESINIDESQICFDDATVHKFFKDLGTITLYALNGTYGEEFKDIILRLYNVQGIDADAPIDSDNLMLAEDGGIICVDLTDNTMTMVVEWFDFQKGSSETKGYKIVFGHYTLELREPIDPIPVYEPPTIASEKQRQYSIYKGPNWLFFLVHRMISEED